MLTICDFKILTPREAIALGNTYREHYLRSLVEALIDEALRSEIVVKAGAHVNPRLLPGTNRNLANVIQSRGEAYGYPAFASASAGVAALQAAYQDKAEPLYSQITSLIGAKRGGATIQTAEQAITALNAIAITGSRVARVFQRRTGLALKKTVVNGVPLQLFHNLGIKCSPEDMATMQATRGYNTISSRRLYNTSYQRKNRLKKKEAESVQTDQVDRV